MTGTCGEPLVFCDQPEGHEGHMHHAEWPMPKETARAIANSINERERQYRRYRRWMWYFIVATAVNVFGAISTLIGPS